MCLPLLHCKPPWRATRQGRCSVTGLRANSSGSRRCLPYRAAAGAQTAARRSACAHSAGAALRSRRLNRRWRLLFCVALLPPLCRPWPSHSLGFMPITVLPCFAARLAGFCRFTHFCFYLCVLCQRRECMCGPWTSVFGCPPPLVLLALVLRLNHAWRRHIVVAGSLYLLSHSLDIHSYYFSW